MKKEMHYYFDPITQRYRYRTSEIYKDVKWTCTGYSSESKADAKRDWKIKRDKRIREIEGKIDHKAGRIKLSADMPAWYDLHMRNKTTKGRPRSAQTIETDMTTMGQILKELGKYNVCDIDADILQSYFNKLAENGSGESTIRKRWILLNLYFKQRNPRDNPLLLCHKPLTKKISAEFMVDDDDECDVKLAYTDGEMERLQHVLLTHPSGKNRRLTLIRGRMLVVIMWQHLRLAEAVELRVKDIDFDEGTINIRRQYDELHRKVVIPKDNSKRIMYIAKQSLDILKHACMGKEAKDLVFDGAPSEEHGGRVLRGALRDTLTAACEEAGVARHNVHDLRHDGISYWIRQGVEPTSIQKWAGHKSLIVTMNVYYRDSGEDNPKDIELVRGIKSKPKDKYIVEEFADKDTKWLVSVAQAAIDELSRRGVLVADLKTAG